MSTLPYSPLLITSRPEFAQLIADCAPEVAIAVHPAETVPARTWASAPAILVDAQAAAALHERALPASSHMCLVTEGHPVSQTWVDAVKLGTRRVVELPDSEPRLARMLRAAARGPAVVVVVGPGNGGTNTATTVAAALAVDAMARGQTAALVGIRPDSTPLEQRVRPGLPITEPPPTGEGRLHVVIRTNRPARPEDVAAVVANLRDDHDLIVIDAAPPSCAAGAAVFDEAHVILVVAVPADLGTPAMRSLRGSLAGVADQARLLVLTAGTDNKQITAIADSGFAKANTLGLAMPAAESLLVGDFAFRNACVDAARLDDSNSDPTTHLHGIGTQG